MSEAIHFEPQELLDKSSSERGPQPSDRLTIKEFPIDDISAFFATAGISAQSEKSMKERKTSREDLHSEVEITKEGIKHTLNVAEMPDGTLRAMVITSWVGPDGKSSITETAGHKWVTITDEQYKALKEQSSNNNNEL